MSAITPLEGAAFREGPPTRPVIDDLTLQTPRARLALAVALVAATLLSPNISLPRGLPAVRLEQVLLLLAAVPLGILHLRQPRFRRLGVVDLGFALFALSTIATVALVPIILPAETRSGRDIFEVARVAEYWLIYRLGRTLEPGDAGSEAVGRILAVAAIALGIVAVLQYLNPPGFNDVVTAVWTQSHNLLGVTREGRAVGTAGNANQFGMLSVMLLAVSLAGRLATKGRSSRILWSAAIAAAAIGVVLGQSRGAILGLALGLIAAAVLLLLRRRIRTTVTAALVPLVAALVILAPLVMLAPPASGSILRRFSVSSLSSDPSLIVRIGRIQTLVTAPGDAGGSATGGADPCSSPSSPATPAPGHEPGSTAPTAADTTDAAKIAAAVQDFACTQGTWPSNLTSDLAPEFLTSPAAPVWQLYTSDRGFVVGRADSITSTSEVAGAGSFPNLLANPSMEGRSGAAPWHGTSDTALAVTSDDAAFGTGSIDAMIPRHGSVYQLLVADLPPSTPYTAGIWVKALDAGASPQLYVTAVTADGTSIDPLAVSEAQQVAPQAWEHIAVSFSTPAARLTSLQIMIRTAAGGMHVRLDGASLTEGPFALPFGSLQDAPASSAGVGPRLADSPVLGLGPQKNEGAAVFDNEYATSLAHYGVLGLLTYVLLFASAFLVAVRASRRSTGWLEMLAIAMVATTLALAVFAISAGAFRQLQFMLPYWLLIGVVAAVPTRPRPAPASLDQTASPPPGPAAL